MNIDIQHLFFKYHKKKEYNLTDINICLNSGNIYCLLGLNGSGKTTLMKLLTGIEKYMEGDILYDKKSLSKISIKERSKVFSYVPQYSRISDDVLVEDYLTFGTANTLAFYQSPKKEQKEKVLEVAERIKITQLLNKKIGEVSGGERQTILIACALIQDAEVIYLDEPTSALDIKNQHLILSILKEISSKSKTVVLTTHNPNHALFLGSKVIVMHKGEVIMHGDNREIVNVDSLKEIYGDAVSLSKDLTYDEISFKN